MSYRYFLLNKPYEMLSQFTGGRSKNSARVTFALKTSWTTCPRRPA